MLCKKLKGWRDVCQWLPVERLESLVEWPAERWLDAIYAKDHWTLNGRG